MLNKEIKFTGLPAMSVSKLGTANAGITQTITPEWARLEFQVDTSRTTLDKVNAWLRQETTKMWSIYKYHDPANHSKYNVVIRFEEKNDAVLFKLSGVYDTPNDN